MLPEELITSPTIINHIALYCRFRHTMHDKLRDLDGDFLPRRSAIILIVKNGGLKHNCIFSFVHNQLIYHGLLLTFSRFVLLKVKGRRGVFMECTILSRHAEGTNIEQN